MPADPAPKKDVHQKKKLIVAAVLAIGLLVAILTQPDRESSDQNTQPMASGLVNAGSSGGGVTTSTSVNESRSTVHREFVSAPPQELSRLDLEHILTLELFVPETRSETAAGVVSEAQPVRAVYGSASGHAALVGGSIVRGGQQLQNVGQVLQITPEGIHVAR